MDTTCHSMSTNGNMVQPHCDSVAAFDERNQPRNVTAVSVSGWMYINESGQMCGPYIQEQLYDGLSSGFLPEELPVYPIVNGNLVNAVPLSYFRQFPDHVATGFVYIGHMVVTGTQNDTTGNVHNLSCGTDESLKFSKEEFFHNSPSIYANCVPNHDIGVSVTDCASKASRTAEEANQTSTVTF